MFRSAEDHNKVVKKLKKEGKYAYKAYTSFFVRSHILQKFNCCIVLCHLVTFVNIRDLTKKEVYTLYAYFSFFF
jgi:hypothetical protein